MKRKKGRLFSSAVEDGRTFEEVVTEHLDALYRTALRMTRGHAANAEDLLQDTLLKAWDGYENLRDPGAARTWLFAILLRTHFNRRRASSRRPESLVSDFSDGEFEDALARWPAAPMSDVRAPAMELREALDALDEPLRSVVLLVDVQGFRQREVAAMLEVPEGTVASRLFRARRELREFLRDDRSSRLSESQ
jgi:RNA polymerase sigma-70 factor (ECF subfamily)